MMECFTKKMVFMETNIDFFVNFERLICSFYNFDWIYFVNLY